MYILTPVEIERISAMPMMPMDPAKLVSTVLPFLVSRFWKERDRAVPKLMEGFFSAGLVWRSSCASSSGLQGMVSSTT